MDLGTAAMADQSFAPDQTDHDDIDFTFEDGGADQAELDDFDFDIGDGAVHVQSEAPPDVPSAEADGSNENNPSGRPLDQAKAAHQADEAVLDEIDYEEETVAPSADQLLEPTASHTEDTHEPESNLDNGDDEINYEEDMGDEVGFSAEPEKAAQQADNEIDYKAVEVSQPGDETQVSNPADYTASNPTGESVSGGYAGTGLDILDVSLATGGLEDMADAAHPEVEIANGYMGNKIADDLNQGLSQLDGLFATTPPSVTVTWGEEVCPLFKTSEDDDPTSFYLDDVAVLNLPLSAFLAGIRKNISSWVEDDDEIHIRIDELGLEFAETTTEALLGQVTFAQLVALHNTLLKNEDPEPSRGFNITLTTRPNCTFRLKELVEGANSGKGLSAFRSKSTPSASSSDSEVNEAVSDEVSPADEEFDGAADRESSNEQDEAVEAQAYSEAESEVDEDEDDIVDYEEQDEGDGDADEHNAEDELDMMTYTNEEETEQQNADTDASNQDNDEATYTAGFEESADDLLSYGDEVDITQGGEAEDSGSLQATARSQEPHQGLDYSQSASGRENDGTLTQFPSSIPSTRIETGQGLSGPSVLFSLAEQRALWHGEPKPALGGGFLRTASISQRNSHPQPSAAIHSGLGSPGSDSSLGDDFSSVVSSGRVSYTIPDTDNGMAYLELDQDIVPHDDGLYGDNQLRDEDLLDDDEYLDLEGDAGQGHATDKVTTQDAQNLSETHGQSSTTSTVNGDEIDYEDHPAGITNGETADATHEPLKELGDSNQDQQAGLDEIDWDDEDKAIAPNAAASPSISITGKRNREEDEADGLVDEGHDNKRHRHEQISS